MQELIQNIMAKAGISEQQATVAVNTTKDFIRSKVPPMATGMVDQFFSGTFDPSAALKAAASQQSDFMSKAREAAEDAREKIADFTEDAIDKGSEFAREATRHMNEWAKQAGGWSEEAMDRVREMFGGKGESKPGGSGQQGQAGQK
jgi:hypothetical protein